MRRTLTIAAIVIVILGLLVAGYFLLFAKDSGLQLQNGVSDGNPFGEAGSDVPPDSTSGETGGSGSETGGTAGETGGTATLVAPHLTQITAKPVARGFIALDASSTAPVALGAASTSAPTPSFGVEVRYIDRESGNMYAYEAGQGTTKRLTDHTAPGVQEASWLPDGSVSYIRFLTSDTDGSEHIETYALPADGSGGFLLARDLSAVIPESANTLFTLMPSTSGSVGSTEKADGSGGKTLFTSELSALAIAQAGTNYVAYTKPAAALPGYAFLVSGAGAFSQILGPLAGLSVLPNPSGKQALFSYVRNGVVSLAMLDTSTRATTALPVATFSDKCVWTSDGSAAYCAVPTTIPSGATLPDAWYQGTAAFSDKLWKIDFGSRVATLVADLPALSDTPIDAVSLSLDANESTLVFMNKRDNSLWAYSF